MSDKEYIAQLEKQISALESQNHVLSGENRDLREKLQVLLDLQAKQSVKKDSSNSSISPSQDPHGSRKRKHKSLRKKSKRKSGGQKGHKGSTLEMSKNPDEIHELKNKFCRACGADLSEASFELHSCRQVIDIELPKPVIREYRAYSCICPSCSSYELADFPENVKAPVQYGSNVAALTSYFSVHQYLPYKRLKELFEEVFSVSLSQGTIDNMLQKMSKKAEPVCEKIRKALENSNAVGSDETGMYVNGDQHWAWVWQNDNFTIMKIEPSRGKKVHQKHFPNGFPFATLGSDRLSAQLSTPSARKQLCIAHLLRELNYLEEIEADDFPKDFKDFFKKVLQAKRASIENQKAYATDDPLIRNLERELDDLLIKTLDEKRQPFSRTFQRSMLKCRAYLMSCLYDLDVPADNNGSERAVRNIKVKQKISGGFKSGQHAYANIKSVTDTAVKKGIEILNTLKNIFESQWAT
jgi:transposase